MSGSLSNEPKRLNWPIRLKSGAATISEGTAGTFKPQPFGFTFVPSKFGPILKALSIATASTVEIMIPRSSAALILRTIRPMVRNSPKAKTTTGQPTSSPPSPRVTGTGPAEVLRTKPESTRPIRAINRPIPTEIAIFNCVGTALNTAVLNPVKTSTVMMIPSRTTNPIASCQVILEAMATATKVFKPRPVANANGKLAITPIRIDRTPATRAVAAAIRARFGASPPPIYLPSASLVKPMIRGFSATMYAIVKNVTTPPRTSWATEDPR